MALATLEQPSLFAGVPARLIEIRWRPHWPPCPSEKLWQRWHGHPVRTYLYQCYRCHVLQPIYDGTRLDKDAAEKLVRQRGWSLSHACWTCPRCIGKLGFPEDRRPMTVIDQYGRGYTALCYTCPNTETVATDRHRRWSDLVERISADGWRKRPTVGRQYPRWHCPECVRTSRCRRWRMR